jgi:hypothetical protein
MAMTVDNHQVGEMDTTIMTDTLAKMERVMDPESSSIIYESHPILQSFQKYHEQTVEARPSSVPGAGTGLFATKKIPAGKIVSLYPVHCLGMDIDDDLIYISSNEEDQKHFDSDCHDSSCSYLQYLMGSRPLNSADGRSSGSDDASSMIGKYPLFVDINPNRTAPPGWSGHLVNDGAIVKENSEIGIMEYYRESQQARNCVHIPFGPSPMIAVVTTRKVQKGEELFTTYGCSYWLQALLDSAQNDEECTDITDQVHTEVRESAREIFVAMQKAAQSYSAEAAAFQSFFHPR